MRRIDYRSRLGLIAFAVIVIVTEGSALLHGQQIQIEGVPVVTADTDQDTTYTAGDGLVLNGQVFSSALPGQLCKPGSAVTGIDASGNLVCVCFPGMDLTDCPAGCVDLLSDNYNCGACGEVCDTGDNCYGGRCGVCDLFGQDCSGAETCYLLLSSSGYPTACAPTVPEPAISSGGCEPVEKVVPQEQGECCSYINTCNVGLGCTQAHPVDDGLVCAEFCDPTETVGIDDCFTKLGAGFFCLAINRFYTDVDDLEDIYGFCLDEGLWGPATCYNDVQDGDEDGVDCCSVVGEPSCSCQFSCG